MAAARPARAVFRQPCNGGIGGAGVSNSISGSAVIYAAGGGGGVSIGNTAGAGGSSGAGGAGGVATTGVAANAANPGSGGGGGGAAGSTPLGRRWYRWHRYCFMHDGELLMRHVLAAVMLLLSSLSAYAQAPAVVDLPPLSGDPIGSGYSSNNGTLFIPTSASLQLAKPPFSVSYDYIEAPSASPGSYEHRHVCLRSGFAIFSNSGSLDGMHLQIQLRPAAPAVSTACDAAPTANYAGAGRIFSLDAITVGCLRPLICGSIWTASSGTRQPRSVQ